jgi:putative copper resistance protein D
MTAWLALTVTMMSGEALSAASLTVVLGETRFGETWIARAILLASLAALAPLRGRIAGTAALTGAAAVLALTAATGHAGATGNGFQLIADTVHLFAVGAWIGGLVPFAAAMRRPGAAGIAWRFSTLGTICVGLILATGLVNGWYLVGTGHALTGTPYGRLLLVKLALFLVILTVAGINRFVLVPGQRIGMLRRNAAIEAAFGATIVVIVAALGTMVPGYYQVTP